MNGEDYALVEERANQLRIARDEVYGFCAQWADELRDAGGATLKSTEQLAADAGIKAAQFAKLGAAFVDVSDPLRVSPTPPAGGSTPDPAPAGPNPPAPQPPATPGSPRRRRSRGPRTNQSPGSGRDRVEVHPATPSHGTEYSSGLEVGDRVA